MDHETTGVDKVGRNPGKGKSRDIVEVLGCVPGTQGLHSHVFQTNVEAIGNAQGEELEDLLLRLVMCVDELVIERIFEADLNQVRIFWPFGRPSGWVENKRNTCWQAGRRVGR